MLLQITALAQQISAGCFASARKTAYRSCVLYADFTLNTLSLNMLCEAIMFRFNVLSVKSAYSIQLL